MGRLSRGGGDNIDEIASVMDLMNGGDFMRKKVIFVLLLMLFLSQQVFAKDWIIRPGYGVGWIKIGMKYSLVKKSFGKADSISPGEKYICYHYRKYGLSFSANFDGYISYIMVLAPGYGKTRYITKSGIQVDKRIDYAISKLGKPEKTEEEYDGTCHYDWLKKNISILCNKNGKIKVSDYAVSSV